MDRDASMMELKSRFRALVVMFGLFVLFLGITLGFALLPTDWGREFANVALGIDSLHLGFIE